MSPDVRRKLGGSLLSHDNSHRETIQPASILAGLAPAIQADKGWKQDVSGHFAHISLDDKRNTRPSGAIAALRGRRFAARLLAGCAAFAFSTCDSARIVFVYTHHANPHRAGSVQPALALAVRATQQNTRPRRAAARAAHHAASGVSVGKSASVGVETDPAIVVKATRVTSAASAIAIAATSGGPCLHADGFTTLP